MTTFLTAVLAGTSDSPGASDVVRVLAEAEPLELIAEPENPYDRLAIRVSHQGRFLGYVGANRSAPAGLSHNREFYEHRAAWASAKFIRSGGHYRVRIEI